MNLFLHTGICAFHCAVKQKENEYREELTVYRMEFSWHWNIVFISLYALPNPVCFGSQFRAVFSGTESQCLKVSSLVIDSVVTGLAWSGWLPSHPHLNFRLGQYASAENDDLKKTYCFFVWNWHFNVIFRLSLGTYYVVVMKSFSGYSISNWKFKALYI